MVVASLFMEARIATLPSTQILVPGTLILNWISPAIDAQLRLANQLKGRTLFETARELRGGLLIDQQESPPLPNTFTLPTLYSFKFDAGLELCKMRRLI